MPAAGAVWEFMIPRLEIHHSWTKPSSLVWLRHSPSAPTQQDHSNISVSFLPGNLPSLSHCLSCASKTERSNICAPEHRPPLVVPHRQIPFWSCMHPSPQTQGIWQIVWWHCLRFHTKRRSWSSMLKSWWSLDCSLLFSVKLRCLPKDSSWLIVRLRRYPLTVGCWNFASCHQK